MARPPAKLPTGIGLTPQGKFRARVKFEGRTVVVGTYDGIENARAALAIAKGEIARGTFVPPAVRRAAKKAEAAAAKDAAKVEQVKGLTVSEWATDWLTGLAALGRSPGTIASYRSTLKVHILPTLGDRRLVDVTSEDIDALVASIRIKKGPTGNVARTTSALFNAALKQKKGGLAESPVNVEMPKARRAKTLTANEIPTPAQLDALHGALPKKRAIAVPLAAWMTTRLGEVLGLQRQDFENLDDPEHAVMHITRQWMTKASPPAYGPCKRGSERSLSIPPWLVPIIQEHLDAYVRAEPWAPILRSRVPRAPMSQTAFDEMWQAARETTGIAFRYHDLRHTGLTEFARQGATLAELMYRGGHTDVASAMIYQTATKDRDRALAAKLAPVKQPAQEPEPTPSATPAVDLDALARLGELHTAGVLTDVEFTAAKARLLGL